MLIAGDIGGTKTKLAVFPARGDPRDPIVKATFPSKEFPNLEAIVGRFLRDENLRRPRKSSKHTGRSMTARIPNRWV